jgi:putative phage-type endonuclease
MSNLIQGTPEWLQMRKNYVGASDTPVIVGVNKYKKTPYILWQEKLGLIEDTSSSWATEYGTNLEPEARKVYEQMTNNFVAPCVIFHKEIPFMMASLDGMTIDGDLAVEIKCINKADHELARQGIIPEQYKPQVYHQLECLGHDKMHYFSYNSGEGIIVEVLKDEQYQTYLKEQITKFWECVETFTSPSFTDDDFIERDKVWETIANDLMNVKNIIKNYQLQESLLEEKLKELSHDKNSFCGEYKYTKSFKKGAVNYSVIPELKDVDLEKYRKNSSTMWRISKVKV